MASSEPLQAVIRAEYRDGLKRDSWSIEVYDDRIEYQGPDQGIIERLLGWKRMVPYDSPEFPDLLADEVQHVASLGSQTGINIYLEGDDRSRVTYDRHNDPPEAVREELQEIFRRIGADRHFESVLEPESGQEPQKSTV